MYKHASAWDTIVSNFSTVDPMDYGELDLILQFDTCDVQQCTFVSIVNDLVDEPEEFFSYTLERTPGLDDRIDLDPTMGAVVITCKYMYIQTFPANYIQAFMEGQTISQPSFISDPSVPTIQATISMLFYYSRHSTNLCMYTCA